MFDPETGTTKLDLKVFPQGGLIQGMVNDQATVDCYATFMRAGMTFPPPVVFYDGATYWIGDGHQRIRAAIQIGRRKIDAYVKLGNQTDAFHHAASVSHGHVFLHTAEDKRRAALLLLNDEVLSLWSNRTIALRCRLTESTVRELRDGLVASSGSSTRTGSLSRERGRTNCPKKGGGTKAARRDKTTSGSAGRVDAGQAAPTPPISRAGRAEASFGPWGEPPDEDLFPFQAEVVREKLNLQLDWIEWMFENCEDEYLLLMHDKCELLANELAAHWPGLADRDPLD